MCHSFHTPKPTQIDSARMQIKFTVYVARTQLINFQPKQQPNTFATTNEQKNVVQMNDCSIFPLYLSCRSPPEIVRENYGRSSVCLHIPSHKVFIQVHNFVSFENLFCSIESMMMSLESFRRVHYQKNPLAWIMANCFCRANFGYSPIQILCLFISVILFHVHIWIVDRTKLISRKLYNFSFFGHFLLCVRAL